VILEICAYNIQSCIAAENAGASRIELCTDPLQGGATPSFGVIQYVLENLSIPVFPMICHRGGRYTYDADDLIIMKKDIIACRQLGCKGIATGVLSLDGTIDGDSLKSIVEWAYPMEVTCHKAFDITPDAFAALETIIDAGCKRILTSGLKKTAMEGAATIAQLITQAAGRITIMPGGSVRSSNISDLAKQTSATEFHSSGITSSKDFISDEREISVMVAILKKL
jgi:copper homeostasis protein